MPAGGTTLRSTADYHETARSSSSGRHHHQHHRLSGPSSYVFAPSWMLRNGKKPPNNDQLAFTSFSGGNNAPHMSFSSRKSDYTRPTVSPLRSSNSSPYPSSWDEEEEEQQNNDKPDASEFPTLTSDDTINKRNEGRSAWSNPHLIKEKVLSPTRIDQVSQLDTGPSLEDIEFERLKALVPKQRTATRKIGNRLSSASPSPSSSSSSSHHHHHRSSHPHPHQQQQQQHSQPHPHHRTSKSSSTHIRATTTNTHRAPFVKKDHPAIVKISTSTHATTSTKRVSSDSGTSTSTSTSSSSSSSGGMQHDTAQQTLSDPPPPTPPTTSTTPPGHLWVDEREKQHFLSWLYTWTCQPGIEWRKDAHALHHHGEYSYFGPLGTKSDASLFYQGNILVHSPWYNYS